MESSSEAIIPGLPHDLAIRCLAKISHGYHGVLETVSKRWRDLIRSTEYSSCKEKEGWCGNWLFVLTEGCRNQWIAYDPEADEWHPLSKIPRPRPHSDWNHFGFSCVSACNKFLLIGGALSPESPSFMSHKPHITNDVFQYDPFTKQWSKAAKMRTARSHFACSVISGKVYVAGGRTGSCSRGIDLCEVYDPVVDRWEDLPPTCTPQSDCFGLSYNGKFYVLSDQMGMSHQDTSEVYSPLDKTWCMVGDGWPFSTRIMQSAFQVIQDEVYTLIDDTGESPIQVRKFENGEWEYLGTIPPVLLPGYPRLLKVFGYGIASVKGEFYVLGGRVWKWLRTSGGFEIVNLDTVRLCNPLVLPLRWRNTRPMCGSGCGYIVGCASLEEE